MEQPAVDLVTAAKPRSPLVLVGTALVSAVIGAGLTAAAFLSSPAPVPVAPPPPASSAAAPVAPKPSSAPPPTTAERAAQGDKAAVTALDQKPEPELSVAEVLALEEARVFEKREHIRELGRKIGILEKYGRDSDTKKEILASARDRELTAETLRMLGGIESAPGPDLIYDVWTDYRGTKESRELARRLLATKEVRARATPALLAVLDLKAVEDCEKGLPALEKAKEVGDRRAVSALARFSQRMGCGEKKNQDCFPCLRTGTVLRDVAAAVQKRPAP